MVNNSRLSHKTNIVFHDISTRAEIKMSSTILFHTIITSCKEDGSIIPTPMESYSELNHEDTDLLAKGEMVEQGKDLPPPTVPSKVPLRDQLKGMA